MIVTKQKPMAEILKYLKGHDGIFLVGCGACAEASFTGGEEDCRKMIEALQKEGLNILGYAVVEEPCHMLLSQRVLREHWREVEGSEALLVLACGAGVQAIASFSQKPVYPALNTSFLGTVLRAGNFTELCSMCGECLLGKTAGVCPVTQCPKGMLNGPCGGVDKGMCEIIPGRACAWVQIYERAREWGKLESLNIFLAPKDYSVRTRPEILVIEPRRQ